MRKVKRRLKPIPMFTIFEKRKALDARRMIEANGYDPLHMTLVASSGISTFDYKNIAHYMELTGSQFDLVKSNFALVKEKDTYERRKRTT